MYILLVMSLIFLADVFAFCAVVAKPLFRGYRTHYDTTPADESESGDVAVRSVDLDADGCAAGDNIASTTPEHVDIMTRCTFGAPTFAAYVRVCAHLETREPRAVFFAQVVKRGRKIPPRGMVSCYFTRNRSRFNQD